MRLFRKAESAMAMDSCASLWLYVLAGALNHASSISTCHSLATELCIAPFSNTKGTFFDSAAATGSAQQNSAAQSSAAIARMISFPL